jgi:hypothetical protein
MLTILDQVVTMTWVDFVDGTPPTRLCALNPLNYASKDFSGRLKQLEEPNPGSYQETDRKGETECLTLTLRKLRGASPSRRTPT